MKDISSVESLNIPAGVEVHMKARTVTVTGPRGTLTKQVRHIQMDMQVVSRATRPRAKRGGGRGKGRVARGASGTGASALQALYMRFGASCCKPASGRLPGMDWADKATAAWRSRVLQGGARERTHSSGRGARSGRCSRHAMSQTRGGIKSTNGTAPFQACSLARSLPSAEVLRRLARLPRGGDAVRLPFGFDTSVPSACQLPSSASAFPDPLYCATPCRPFSALASSRHICSADR